MPTAKSSKSSPSILSYFSSQPTPKPKKNQAPQKGKKCTLPPADDIIIISDEDRDDTPTSKRKKDASSDIEIVGECPKSLSKKPKLEQTVKKAGEHSNVEAPSETPSRRLVFGRANDILRVKPSLLSEVSTSEEQSVAPETPRDLDVPVTSQSSRDNAGVPDSIEDPWLDGDEELDLFGDPPEEIVEDEEDDIFDASFKHLIEGPSNSSSSKQPPIAKSCSGNAFSILMSSNKETEAWKEADIEEDRTFRPTKDNRRKAPFYKILQGMPIAVDAFRYGSIPGVTAYFLTHAHSDHYTNLSPTWGHGPIYCSTGTAKLILHMLKVDEKWVKPLPNDVPCTIPDTGGVKVTLIEANHCPGSSLFLFEGPQTIDAGDSTFKSAYVGSERQFRYLHCGDFRASPAHILHPAVKNKRIDICYLDTTYLDPKYIFPPQPQVISACAELAKRIASGKRNNQTAKGSIASWALSSSSSSSPSNRPNQTLFAVGTYSIGKERIVKAIAQALHSKVYCDARKMAILQCQDDPELHAMLTRDPLKAVVHVVPLGTITSDKLKVYIQRYKGHFINAVGFRPTGWTYTPSPGSTTVPSIQAIISKCQGRTFTWDNLKPSQKSIPSLEMYGVPYSEHSSFFELTCFCMSLDCVRFVATVNVGSEKSRGKMNKWFERWESERKKRRDAAGGRLDIFSHRGDDYW